MANDHIQSLVERLKQKACLSSPQVEAAFRTVPRHLFVPQVTLEEAYEDQVIITKSVSGRAISSSSQPAIMAIMLEQLDLKPGHKVLEIGAGTGYNAALMAHIVGETGQIFTIDLDEDIVIAARQHLAAADFDQVEVICADGGYGYLEAAPYDRIILSVGAVDITPAWQRQLKPGGKLVLPLSVRSGLQLSTAFVREREGGEEILVSQSIRPCGFMMLRGHFSHPDGIYPLSLDADLHILIDNPALVDSEMITSWLKAGSSLPDKTTGVEVYTLELWQGLRLWLTLYEPNYFLMMAEGEWTKNLPFLQGEWGKSHMVRGVLGQDTFVVLIRPPSVPEGDEEHPFELMVRTFGPDPTLADRLIDDVVRWEAQGRPFYKSLRIKAYPQNVPYQPTSQEVVLDKRWTQLVFRWLFDSDKDSH